MKKCMTWIALCICALFLLTACTGNSYSTIQPPNEKLSWGMTQAEVLEALGLSEDDVQKMNDTGTAWNLTPQQSGISTVADMHVTVEHGVRLYFGTYGDEDRLNYIELAVHASNGKDLEQNLTKTYGSPVSWETAQYWVSVDPNKTGSDADFGKLNEFELGTALQISSGQKKLYAVRPIIALGGTTEEPLIGYEKTVSQDSPADFILQFNAKTYLLAQYGS